MGCQTAQVWVVVWLHVWVVCTSVGCVVTQVWVVRLQKCGLYDCPSMANEVVHVSCTSVCCVCVDLCVWVVYAWTLCVWVVYAWICVYVLCECLSACGLHTCMNMGCQCVPVLYIFLFPSFFPMS